MSYLSITLANAPDDPDNDHQDPNGTEGSIDPRFIHIHDEHPNHNQEESQNDKTIAKRLVLCHFNWPVGGVSEALQCSL